MAWRMWMYVGSHTAWLMAWSAGPLALLTMLSVILGGGSLRVGGPKEETTDGAAPRWGLHTLRELIFEIWGAPQAREIL